MGFTCSQFVVTGVSLTGVVICHCKGRHSLVLSSCGATRMCVSLPHVTFRAAGHCLTYPS